MRWPGSSSAPFKIVGVPQASLVIAIALGAGAVVLAAWGVRQLLVRRVAAQDPA